MNKENSFEARLKRLDGEGENLDVKYAQKRGYAFEQLICDVFEHHGLLTRRSYHTEDNKSQQIDGAISFSGRHALIEAKWVSSNMAASTLYAFIGKIETKFTGTIGIFVSRKELSENFLNAVAYGRKRNVMVIHDEDITFLMKEDFPLKNYIEEHLLFLSVDNGTHLAARRFYVAYRKKAEIEERTEVDQEELTKPLKLLNKCMTDEKLSNIMDEEVEKFSVSERVECASLILNEYAEFLQHGVSSDQPWQRANFSTCIEELVAQSGSERVESDKIYYIDHLSKGFEDKKYSSLIEVFAPRYRLLTTEERRLFESRLKKNWSKAIGIYEQENILAPITQGLWDDFTDDTRIEILKHAISFVCGYGRYDTYPQMRMAKTLLSTERNSRLLKKALKAGIKQDIERKKELGYEEELEANFLVKSERHEYQKIRKYIDNYDSFVESYIKKLAS